LATLYIEQNISEHSSQNTSQNYRTRPDKKLSFSNPFHLAQIACVVPLQPQDSHEGDNGSRYINHPNTRLSVFPSVDKPFAANDAKTIETGTCLSRRASAL